MSAVHMASAVRGGAHLTFGEALRRVRCDADFSHNDIANQCGVNRRTIKEWERDEGSPRASQIVRLVGTLPRLKPYLHLIGPDSMGMPIADAVPAAERVEPMTELPARPLPATFPAALRAERKASGLEQHELGDLVGVTGQAVSFWETGTNVPVRAHYEALRALYPDLARFDGDAFRDIDKPDGGGARSNDGGGPVPAQEEAIEMANHVNGVGTKPGFSPEERAYEDALARSAAARAQMIEWGRAVYALRTSDAGEMARRLIRIARDAGMTIDEVAAALADP